METDSEKARMHFVPRFLRTQEEEPEPRNGAYRDGMDSRVDIGYEMAPPEAFPVVSLDQYRSKPLKG